MNFVKPHNKLQYLLDISVCSKLFSKEIYNKIPSHATQTKLWSYNFIVEIRWKAHEFTTVYVMFDRHLQYFVGLEFTTQTCTRKLLNCWQSKWLQWRWDIVLLLMAICSSRSVGRPASQSVSQSVRVRLLAGRYSKRTKASWAPKWPSWDTTTLYFLFQGFVVSCSCCSRRR